MVKQLKEIKEIQIRKEEVKTSLLIDDVIVYISDPEHSSREILYLINIFSEVAS